MTSLVTDAVKARFERFAETECKGYSALYDELARATASDDELVAFIASMPETQPNLFFAAIQFLTGPEAMPASGGELRKFVANRRGEVEKLMHTRRTQTNEVGRCAILLPALPRETPLALIEVGASAGLCLLLDRFFYDYSVATVGDEASSVRLRCELDGPAQVPPNIPQIAWRVGLDENPIDLHNEQAVRWLLACVWADHTERRKRLEAAIDLSRQHDLRVRRGDLAVDLHALLAEAPSGATLVVFHSAVLNYVSSDKRARFTGILAEASRHRRVVWISNEAPHVVPEITAMAAPMKVLNFLLGRTLLDEGVRRDRLLGFAHPHGATLQWIESAMDGTSGDETG